MVAPLQKRHKMAIHLGKLVESVREKNGITWAELARRIKYHPNSIPLMRKREHWNTDLIDRVCAALKYNFYMDKAKEMAAILDPSGVSEPVVPYETESWKAKYQECKRATDPLLTEVKLLREQITDKNKLIINLEDTVKLLKGQQIINGNTP